MIVSIIILLIMIGLIINYGIPALLGVIAFFIVVVAISNNNEKSKVEEQKKRILNRKQNIDIIMKNVNGVFRSTKELSREYEDIAIYIDEIRRKIMFVNLETKENVLYLFNEIVECSILEDGSTIQSGGVGRAVIGGVVAGGVGAIVGASTRSSKPVTFSLSVRIITSNIQTPLYEISLISGKIERESIEYKKRMNFAQEIYATIVSITNYSKNNSYPRSTRRF